MADDVCRLDAKGVQQPGHVRHHVLQPVGGDLLRPAGPAEPAHVRRDHPETVAHQERHLVAPEPRGIGETVHEQHRNTGAVLLDVQGYAVDLDEPPRIRVHARLGRHLAFSWAQVAAKSLFRCRNWSLLATFPVLPSADVL
jgi:hypothetical protein